MLKNFDSVAGRDLLFIPVGIIYDRVFEDRTLRRKRDNTLPRHGLLAALFTTLKLFVRNPRLMMTGRWYRYGYAGVDFGRPLPMREFIAREQVDFRGLEDATHHRVAARVGQTLMAVAFV